MILNAFDDKISHTAATLTLAIAGSAGLGCDAAPPEPPPAEKEQAVAEEKAPEPAKPVVKKGGDPLGGKFSLDDATKGLEGTGKLTATIKTSLGTVTCELFDDKAPNTVANFIGLARGLRPYKYKGEWVKKPGYDGTIFHRVIKGFMIQGGDPNGTGAGEPGYVIKDEIWAGAKHDKRGQLCMANRGPNTNGMQFFITDAKAKHLDGGYTIFGQCGPDDVIEKLASVETPRSLRKPGGDRPTNPPVIESVTISKK